MNGRSGNRSKMVVHLERFSKAMCSWNFNIFWTDCWWRSGSLGVSPWRHSLSRCSVHTPSNSSEPTSMQSHMYMSTWSLLLKHTNSMLETMSNSVYADWDCTSSIAFSPVSLLFLRRGTSSHALFDGVACVRVTEWKIRESFLLRKAYSAYSYKRGACVGFWRDRAASVCLASVNWCILHVNQLPYYLHYIAWTHLSLTWGVLIL